ncbi:hypothetical protein HYP58_gp13 [Vibrio phage 1.097.O._10N.286.49.B3]|uniref:Uncharacterized protein n=1 Tax=Vibrio phage 1.097.O._10N.286.49.B3 TaxID=1881383 RepID=A0A2I7R0J8_9CAUD|nr:hypothetical protein HYP58_gp13 [Vibrio phage 1.097.O._10N.286.49.B3]AUR87159.1 hypothetical protein NVP1097O_13 [Vibrio phage 1.097.O._10N.286.49.B3]
MFNETQGYVKDLPVVMQPFYQDELRREPTGEQIEETYIGFDADGNKVELVRMVDEYVDVNYVVEKPRYDLKSWDYVEKAQNYEAKINGIYKACEAEQWAYHDEYVEWYFRPEPKRAQDENGQFIGDDPETPENEAWENGFTPEMYDAQPEPIDTSTKPEPVIEELHQELAIQTRYDAIYDVLLISKGLIDIGIGKDGVKGITNLTDTLDAIALGMDSSEGVMWIMADNVATLLQLEDIEEAVVKFNARKQAVFTAYAEWRSGDMQSPFTVGGTDT